MKMRHYMLGSCACGVALLALSATISVTTAAECTTGDTGVGDEWPEEVKMPKLLYLWLPGYDSYGLTIFNDVRTYMQSRDSGWTADRFAVADTPADLSSYTQIWLYDLSYSASDSNYAAQYKRIADWWRMDNRREVVCDGRILSSVHKGRTQIYVNFFENMRLRGGGVLIGSDHNSFHLNGANDLNAQLGLSPFFGNYAGPKMPVDEEHPLIAHPVLGAFQDGSRTTLTLSGKQRVLTYVMWDHTSTGSAPFNRQPNGIILYTVGFHSGNVNSPGLSSTIRGTLNFQVEIARPVCRQDFVPGSDITFQATIVVYSVEPYTFQWMNTAKQLIGTGQSLTVSSLHEKLGRGAHIVTVLSTDNQDLSAEATVRINIGLSQCAACSSHQTCLSGRCESGLCRNCPPLSAPYASIQCMCMQDGRETCNQQCLSGYRAIGGSSSVNRTCTQDGESGVWSGQPFQCVPDCDSPSSCDKLRTDEQPLGSKANPAPTCFDIFMRNGGMSDGLYWVRAGKMPLTQAYCDSQGFQLVAKFSNAVGSGDQEVGALWEAGTLNADNTALFRVPSEAVSKHYVSHYAGQWGLAHIGVDTAQVQMYAGGSAVKAVAFNGALTDQLSWFSEEALLRSSWKDLQRGGTIHHIGITDYSPDNREFFLSQSSGGCQNDAGWMVAIGNPGSCAWEQTQSNKPWLRYATGSSAATFTSESDVGTADTMTVWARHVGVSEGRVRPGGVDNPSVWFWAGPLPTRVGVDLTKQVIDISGNSRDGEVQGEDGVVQTTTPWAGDHRAIITNKGSGDAQVTGHVSVNHVAGRHVSGYGGSFTVMIMFRRDPGFLADDIPLVQQCSKAVPGACSLRLTSAQNGRVVTAAVNITGEGGKVASLSAPINGDVAGWHYVTLVHDATQRLTTLYVDGQKTFATYGGVDEAALPYVADDASIIIGLGANAEFADFRAYYLPLPTAVVTAEGRRAARKALLPTLALWWPLREAYGPQVADLSTGGNFGILQEGSKWEKGSLQVKAVAPGVVSVRPVRLESGDPEFTLGFWVRPTTTSPGSFQPIVSIESDAGHGTNQVVVVGLTSGAPSVHFGAHSVDSTSTVPGAGSSAITTHWTHITVVHRSGSKSANTQLFINGAQVEAVLSGPDGSAKDAALSLPANAHLVLGRHRDGTLGTLGAGFEAQVSDVRLFSSALDHPAVRAVAQTRPFVNDAALNVPRPKVYPRGAEALLSLDWSMLSAAAEGADHDWVMYAYPFDGMKTDVRAVADVFGTASPSLPTGTGLRRFSRLVDYVLTDRRRPVGLQDNNAFTVAAWVYGDDEAWMSGDDATAGKTVPVVGLIPRVRSTSPLQSITVRVTATGELRLAFGGDVMMAPARTADIRLAPFEWHHIAVVRQAGTSRSAGTKLYVDGADVGALQFVHPADAASDADGLALVDTLLALGSPHDPATGTPYFSADAPLRGYVTKAVLYRNMLWAEDVAAVVRAQRPDVAHILALRAAGDGSHAVLPAFEFGDESFTLDVTVYAVQPLADHQTLVFLGDGESELTMGVHLAPSNGHLIYSVNNMPVTAQTGSVESAMPFPRYQWVRVLIQHDKVSGNVFMYWNGDLVAASEWDTSSLVPIPAKDTRAQAVLGRAPNSPADKGFSGMVSDFAIWKGIQSIEQLAALTVAPSSIRASAAIIHIPFGPAVSLPFADEPVFTGDLKALVVDVSSNNWQGGAIACRVTDGDLDVGPCLVSPIPDVPRCGDGVRDPATEECDDGNGVDGDGCARDCRLEVATTSICWAKSAFEASLCEHMTQLDTRDSFDGADVPTGTLPTPWSGTTSVAEGWLRLHPRMKSGGSSGVWMYNAPISSSSGVSVFMERLIPSSVASDWHLVVHFLARIDTVVRSTSLAKAAPLVVTLYPTAAGSLSPESCTGTSCSSHRFYRLCVNTDAVTAAHINCDTITTQPTSRWLRSEIPVRSRFEAKYGKGNGPTTPWRIQFGMYTTSGGRASAAVDDVSFMQSKTVQGFAQTGACASYAAFSGLSGGNTIKHQSCRHILNIDSSAQSGVYTIHPPGTGVAVDVYCDMTTSGGGWMRMQRRVDGSETTFNPGYNSRFGCRHGFVSNPDNPKAGTWQAYKEGFGTLSNEHWLGNDKIHMITNSFQSVGTEMRIEERRAGSLKWSEYNQFSLGSEATKYTMYASQYSGSHAHSAQMDYINGRPFSTADSDNDAWPSNCALEYQGGWWYGSCHNFNLNGWWTDFTGDLRTNYPQMPGACQNAQNYANHITDSTWLGTNYVAISETIMMFREHAGFPYESLNVLNILLNGQKLSSGQTTGLHLASFTPGNEAATTRTSYISNLASSSSLKAFVDGAATGDIVIGTYTGSATVNMDSNHVAALQTLGVSVPRNVVPGTNWVFAGRKDADPGQGTAVLSYGSVRTPASFDSVWACVDQGTVTLPESELEPVVQLLVEAGAMQAGAETYVVGAVDVDSGAASSNAFHVERGSVRVKHGLLQADGGASTNVQLSLGGTLNGRFDSGWRSIASQQAGSSVVSFGHRFDSRFVEPEYLNVDVRMRLSDGPNAGFEFAATSASQHTDVDGGIGRYAGAIFAYNDKEVRVILPSRTAGTDRGHAFTVGNGWGGEVFTQATHKVDIRARVAREEAAAYDSGWFILQSNQGTASRAQRAHGLGSMPGRVKLMVRPSSGEYAGYIFESIGMPQADTSAAAFGGAFAVYDASNIRVYAPDVANGFIVHVGSGWGTASVQQASHAAMVRVMAWHDQRPPSFASDWMSMSSTSDGSFRQITHGLGFAPDRVQVRIKNPGGNNRDMYFEGTGSVQADAVGSGAYGGVLVGVSENAIRLWAPSPRAGSGNGRVVALPAGWGEAGVQVAEATALVQVRVWAAHETAEEIASMKLRVLPVVEPPSSWSKVVELRSDAVTGTAVTALSSVDEDGPLAYRRFRIVSGNSAGAFTIGEYDGAIIVADSRSLDYSKQPIHTLGISVSDSVLQDRISVQINLLHINRPPMLADTVRNVTEGSPINTNVGDALSALDPDGDGILYSIVDGNADGMFKIDTCTGQVRVSKDGLDFETKNQYNLTVRVVDDGTPQRKTEITLLVDILDKNDPPECIDQTAVIAENSSPGTQVIAIGAVDSEGNALSYSIVSGGNGVFSTTSAGFLVVAVGTTLNFEQEASFSVVVQVSDGGGDDSVCASTIAVSITDANDPPVCATTTMWISESVGGSEVAGVLAVIDEDAGRGDAVTVAQTSSSPARDLLAVDSEGRVTVLPGAVLDFETRPNITLQVTLTDLGGPTSNRGVPAVTTASVLIRLRDANDAPILMITNTTVVENVDSYTELPQSTVVAVDPDASNDQVFYRLTPTTSPFMIGGSTGWIAVRTPAMLDFEAGPAFYDLLVTATDEHGAASSSMLRITVADGNEPPEFTSCVSDRSVMRVHPGFNAVRALVGVYGWLIKTYSGVSTADACFQACHSDTGFVCAAVTWFSTSYFNAALRGKCIGRLTGDEWEVDTLEAISAVNTPVCGSATIAEDTATSTVVLPPAQDFTATDPEGDTATFSIVGGDPEGVFTISGNKLVVDDSAKLDYEAAREHWLIVAADDGKSLRHSQQNTTVYVKVTDVDEPVEFTVANTAVPEGKSTDTVIGTGLGAVDPEGGDITYTIASGNSEGFFKVVGDELRLAKELTKPEGTIFTLTITAGVATSGLAATSATFTVTVIQGNNRPLIAAQVLTVPENSPTGTVLQQQVQASDPDSDSLTFQLSSGTSLEARARFAVSSTGAVSVVSGGGAVLNYEVQPWYILKVQITDDGTPRMSASADVNITLLDVNEPPICTGVTTSVAEDTATGALLGVILACTDVDGSDLTYHLDEAGTAGGLFTLVEQSRYEMELRLAPGRVVDYEARSDYSLSCRVNDGANDVVVPVVITVTDVPEWPVLSHAASLTVSLREDMEGTKTPFMSINATDPDRDTLRYSLQSGNDLGLIRIDSGYGDLFLAEPHALDFEDSETHTLRVQVADRQHVLNVTVSVKVVDVVDVTVHSVQIAGGSKHLHGVGGNELIISGTNFGRTARARSLQPGLVQPIVVVTYGTGAFQREATGCTISTANTEIRCHAEEGVGAALPVTVTVGSIRVPTTFTLSYELPRPLAVIGYSTGTQVAGLRTTGGDEVAFIGYGFGNATSSQRPNIGVRAWYGDLSVGSLSLSGSGSSTPVVYRAETCRLEPMDPTIEPEDTVSWVMVVCKVVPGVGRNLKWMLEVGGQRSVVTSSIATSFRSPQITAVTTGTPAQDVLLDTVGGDSVTIRGTNLGPKAFVVVVDPGTEQEKLQTIAAPSSTVTYGRGHSGEFDASGCQVVSNHVAIRCTTGAGVGRALQWSITVGGLASVDAFKSSMAYHPPVVSKVTGPGADSANTAGGEGVDIFGRYFGPASLSSINRVTYGARGQEFVAESCVVKQDGVSARMSCLTAAGTGRNHSWTVVVANQSSGAQWLGSSYGPPVITSFEEDKSEGVLAYRVGELDTRGMQVVLVHGANFGRDDTTLQSVRYTMRTSTYNETYDAVCTIISPHRTLRCLSQAGAGGDLSWTVMVDGQQSISPVTAYGVPELHGVVGGAGVNVAALSGDGEEVIWLTGINFASQRYLDWVKYGPSGTEYQLQNVVVVNDTTLYGTTEPGVGPNLQITMSVADQLSAAGSTGRIVTVSYAPPQIVSVQTSHARIPTQQRSSVVQHWTEAGYNMSDPQVQLQLSEMPTTEVTVTGYNFGLLDPRAAVAITVGGARDATRTAFLPVTSAKPQSGSTTHQAGGVHTVTFTMRSGLGIDRAVQVQVYPAGAPSAVVSSNVKLLSYAAPDIEYIEVKALPASWEAVAVSRFPELSAQSSDDDRADLSAVRYLRIVGTNFGPPQSETGDAVRRIVQLRATASDGMTVLPPGERASGSEAPAPLFTERDSANFSSVHVHVMSWSSNTSHTEIDCIALQRYAEVRLMLVAQQADRDADAVQYSDLASYQDMSPSISGRTGADGSRFHTFTMEGDGKNFLSLDIQNLRSAEQLEMRVGALQQPCPLYAGPEGARRRVDPANVKRDIIDPVPDQGAGTVWTVTCKVPSGEGMQVPVSVVRNGAPSPPIFIDYYPPAIQRMMTPVTQPSGASRRLASLSSPVDVESGGILVIPTEGTRVRFEGAFLGLCPRVTVTSSAAMFNLITETTRWCNETNPTTGASYSATPGVTRDLNQTWIEFDMPHGEGSGSWLGLGGGRNASYEFEVIVGGQRQTCAQVASQPTALCTRSTPLKYAYLPPTITSVAPSRVSTAGGDLITITGTNFGRFDPGDPTTFPTVYIGGIARTPTAVGLPATVQGGSLCTNVMQSSHQSLSCRAPAGSGQNYSVHVLVSEQAATRVGAFHYEAPRITRVYSMDHAATAVPPTSAVGSKSGDLSTAVTGMVGGNTTGNFSIVIEGLNFGPASSTDACVYLPWTHGGARVRQSYTLRTCPAASAGQPSVFDPLDGLLPASMIDTRNHTHILLRLPEGAGTKDLLLIIGGQRHELPAAVRYNPPVIERMSPDSGPTKPGQIITLYGWNFGAACLDELHYIRVHFFDENRCISNSSVLGTSAKPAFVSTCFRNGAELKAVSSAKVEGFLMLHHSHTRIQFRAVGGVGVDQPVSVAMQDGETGPMITSNSVLYSFFRPSITAFIPQPALMRGEKGALEPILITMTGENFGTTDIEADGVRIGGHNCTVVRAKSGLRPSDEEVECMLSPPITVGRKNSSVAIAFQQGYLDDESPHSLLVACGYNWYGREGEECMACPQGGVCQGYHNKVHTDPYAEPDWYVLNGTGSECPEQLQRTRGWCPYVVPCEPKEACLGENICRSGYKSKAPMFRCSSCEDCTDENGESISDCKRHFRRAGLCVPCPDNAWVLILAFFVGAIVLCIGGYMLNRKNVNLAFVSIAVDYFQILAMFANSRVAWPAAMLELFHMLSVFNLSIDITAPECTIPDLGYVTKWLIIEALPLAALSIFAMLHVILYLKKRIIQGRKKNVHRHISTMIATALVMMYLLYLYLTRTILDVFNCSPTDPPDGKQYLEVVFEECGKPGGVQRTLLPLAIPAMAIYTFGFPILVAYLLHRNRYLIMQDQLLRAQDLGRSRLENPHAYDLRKRCHRLYYQFRPQFWYWMLVVIGRKFCIAFTSLMFNKNPGFQLAMALLVMFVAYALQVKFSPFMSPSDHQAVLREHAMNVKAGSTLAIQLNAQIQDILARGKKRGQHTMRLDDTSVSRARQAGQAAKRFLLNYNTFESTLLFCSVVVTLSGVMFESKALATDHFTTHKNVITVTVMTVLITSILYIAWAFWVEVGHHFFACCRRKSAKTAKDAGAKRSKKGGQASDDEDYRIKAIDEAERQVFEQKMNPMFAVGSGNGSNAMDIFSAAVGHGEGLPAHARAAFDEIRKSVDDLRAENRELKAKLDQATVTGGRVERSAPNRREFGQLMSTTAKSSRLDQQKLQMSAFGSPLATRGGGSGGQGKTRSTLQLPGSPASGHQ